jgi:hypothetical protein
MRLRPRVESDRLAARSFRYSSCSYPTAINMGFQNAKSTTPSSAITRFPIRRNWPRMPSSHPLRQHLSALATLRAVTPQKPMSMDARSAPLLPNFQAWRRQLPLITVQLMAKRSMRSATALCATFEL